jgi:hypothetical protein
MSSLIRREHTKSTSSGAPVTQLAGYEGTPAVRDSGLALEEVLCPVCHRRLFSRNEAVVRLRTRILVFEGNNAYAKCKYCRNDVMVPLIMPEIFSEESLSLWDETLHGETR